MKKVKLYVDAEEEYPVFFLSPDRRSWHMDHDVVELTEEQYEQYQQAMDEYNNWQKRIKTLIGGRY